MSHQIQLRRDTAANWTSTDPILAQGEIGYETDTNTFKIGDGTSLWSVLSYFSGGGGGASALDDLTDVTITAAATGEVLRYNGSAWVDASLVKADISDFSDGDYATASHTHPHTDITDWDTEVDASADARIAAASIDDLTDVDTSTAAPTDGQVLTWVDADSEWAPADATGGGGGSGSVTLQTMYGSCDATPVSANIFSFMIGNAFTTSLTNWSVVGDAALQAGFDASNAYWTVPETGRYRITATDNVAASADNVDISAQLDILNNGTSLRATAYEGIETSDGAFDYAHLACDWVGDLTAGDQVTIVATRNSGTSALRHSNCGWTVTRLDFDSTVVVSNASDITGTTAGVDLPIGRAVWNSNTATIAAASNLNIFDSALFGSAAAVTGMDLTSDFTFSASSGTWGFIAPEDGNYSVSFQGSIGYSSGALVLKSFGNWQVNAANVTGETLYNYDDIGSNRLFPMTDTCVLALTAGDRVSYQISAASGSGTLNFRYGQVDVTQLTFDATLLTEQVIDSDLVSWSDRATPLTAANQATYTATIVGTGADGRPIYEAYEELTDDYSTPYTATALWTGNLLDANSVNIEVELIRGYDGTGSVEYRGMTSVGQFGFFMNLSGAANALNLGRSTTDTSSNWGSGSIMGIRTRWQDSTDTAGATSVVVPQTVITPGYGYVSLGSPTTPGLTGATDAQLFSPITDFGDASLTTSVVNEDASLLVSSNLVDATGRWTPPAGTYKVEAAYAQGDSTAGESRLRLAKNGTNIAGTGRTEVKTTTGEGDQWCQMSWIVEANGTDYFTLLVEANTGTATVSSCSYNIIQLLT